MNNSRKYCIWFSNYDYPSFQQGFIDDGHTVYAGDNRNWWIWRDRVVKEFTDFMLEDTKKVGAEVVIIGKGLDSNKHVTDVTPPYWHITVEPLLELRKRGVTVVHLDLDSPDSYPWITQTGLLGSCDIHGTCCIGIKKELEKWTEGEVIEFWPAWDHILRTVPPVRSSWDYDFLLCGTPYLNPNPEFGIPRRDIARIALNAGARLAIYGPDSWLDASQGGDPELEPYFKGQAEWNNLHNTLAASKIVYNSFLRRGFRYLNDRVPIAGGGGAFLLMEDQMGLDLEFPRGVMCGYHKYRDPNDVEEQIKYWLGDDSNRMLAALAMQKHILEHHTYVQRAQSIMLAIHRSKENLAAKRKKERCCR